MVAYIVWSGGFPRRYVVSYIDNEASRMALIKSYSDLECANALIHALLEAETSSQWRSWFGRVPTHSNHCRPAQSIRDSKSPGTWFTSDFGCLGERDLLVSTIGSLLGGVIAGDAFVLTLWCGFSNKGISQQRQAERCNFTTPASNSGSYQTA